MAMQVALGALVALAGAVAPAAQTNPFELSLRDGRTVLASSLRGDPQRGFEAVVDGAPRRIGADELVAVHGAAAKVVELPALHAPDGDVVYGQLVGGDANGDTVELQSPVLGRQEFRIDRVAAIAAAGVRDPLRLHLPDGVAEAIFLRAGVGHDMLAGALHRCGDTGVLFAPDGADAPRWFAPQSFVALRIADPTERRAAPAAWLTTRTGDRLAVALRRWTEAAVQLELDGGAVVDLRVADLACLCFTAAGTFASDLVPTEVTESGIDAEVLYPWQRDRSVLGDPLVVGGRSHAKGLGVHSRSRLVFAVPADAAFVWTRVGLDDAGLAAGVAAEVDVRVLVDGAVKFEQRGLRAGRPRDSGLLPVRAGQTVAFEVDCGRGRDVGDRVDWLSPVFLPAAGRRP
ncbi:MAG: NPCBM/NEW2 domain-containing protein [Planctomycetes bacterium]|nr:NPCBM/NEW2 domain-containing protein [Planctomycetota bacterium]